MCRIRCGTLASICLLVVAATGCRACGEPPDDQPEEVDTGSEEPEQVDTGPSEQALEDAEDSAVSIAVSMGDNSRYIAGNVEAQNTPDEPAPDPTPTPRIPDETSGSLQPAQLQKVFSKHAGEAQKCYERALKMNQSLSGRVVLTLTIGRDGSVAAADARGDTLNDNNVNDCLERQARAWTFPEPSGGAAKVRKPFTFSPKR